MLLLQTFYSRFLIQFDVCGCSFLDVPITDRRDAPLQAIKLRYSDESFLKVAHIPVSFYISVLKLINIYCFFKMLMNSSFT